MASNPSPKDNFDDDYDDRPMWKRRPITFFGIVLAFAGAAAYVGTRPTPEKVKAPKVEREITISLPPMPPPPPPPPPPPKVEPPKEEEIVKQETPVETPDPPPDAAPDPSPPSSNAPSAPGGILAAGNGRKGTGTIGGGKKRGKFDGFVISTQKALVSALKGNAATKTAALKCEASLWSDSTGRITKAVLKNISGDSKVAQTMDSSILEGFQLPEAPPVGMPMPINMRISIERPN